MAERPRRFDWTITVAALIGVVAIVVSVVLVRQVDDATQARHEEAMAIQRQASEDSRRRAEAEEQRHMAEMEEIRRQGRADDKRHAEAMEDIRRRGEADDERHEEAMANHEESMEALRALIRNTAPPEPRTSLTGRPAGDVGLAIRPGE